ncbi:hypothetical protein CEXT_553501 [Caerostris extrusa]|uniref:Uncharacterized protein n=1 Tax=Caerostris extrusa TaxID=172846 RepID=A0AAV4VAJ9_CAEEX|nr:hypothetical protein CEXT_553501 [Caerostris extrusa]
MEVTFFFTSPRMFSSSSKNFANNFFSNRRLPSIKQAIHQAIMRNGPCWCDVVCKDGKENLFRLNREEYCIEKGTSSEKNNKPLSLLK